MAVKSNIEWTGHTWNPIAGCSVLSPGCTNCYAMKMAQRLAAMGQALYLGLTKPSKAGPVWTGVMRQAMRDVVMAPLRRKKPTTYFVNSMGDLFHEKCPDEWIDKVFAVMALCPQHTFQVLTKRAERMRAYFNGPYPSGDGVYARIAQATFQFAPHTVPDLPKLPPYIHTRPVGPSIGGDDNNPEFGWRRFLHPMPLPNVWLGVSTERQKEADERIPLLLQTPAAVRFISAEPLLGPINIKPWLYQWGCSCGWGGPHGADLCEECAAVFDGGASDTDSVDCPQCGTATNSSACPDCKYGADYGPNPSRLDWVIGGFESGPDARQGDIDHARSLRDQCAASNTPFFWKQNGEWLPVALATMTRNHSTLRNGMVRVGKKAAGRLLDGITHDAMPSPKGQVITPPARRAAGE